MDDMTSTCNNLVIEHVIALILTRIAEEDPHWVKSQYTLTRLNYANATALNRDMPPDAAAAMGAALVSKVDELFRMPLEAIRVKRGNH